MVALQAANRVSGTSRAGFNHRLARRPWIKEARALPWPASHGETAVGATCWAMAQRNAAISRAMAVVTTGSRFPLAISRR